MGTHSLVDTTDPGREDIDTRGKDVDQAAVVGEPRPRVGDVGGADGAGGGLAGRRVERRVVVAVAGRHSKEHARLDEGRGRRVDGRRLAAAQGHVGDGAVGAAAGGRVGRDKVDAGDHAGRGAGAARVEDLDGEELRLLGDAVVLAADGAGDVRAVPVAVLEAVVPGKVGEEGGATLELLGGVSLMVLTGEGETYSVLDVDASVNHVRAGAGAGARVIRVRRGILGAG